MVRRSGLGKGLGALIPPTPGVATGSMLREVPLARIRPNPFQPRNQFGEQGLSALVDSIKAVGILQPVLVREVGPDEFELIAGERRFRAARRAGLQSIPALVHQADDAMSLEEALVENLHREDLNPLDEAGAYQQLIEEFNLTHEEVARKVGRSRAGVTNALRLFQLPPRCSDMYATANSVPATRVRCSVHPIESCRSDLLAKLSTVDFPFAPWRSSCEVSSEMPRPTRVKTEKRLTTPGPPPTLPLVQGLPPRDRQHRNRCVR